MKNIEVILDEPCSCPNMHLLDSGEVCELCMRVVVRPKYLGEIPDECDPFDELYFEELESYFDDIEYAA